MSVNYTLLALLYRHDDYGYGLKKNYDKLFSKDKELAFGQVYSTLSRLKRDGRIQEIKTVDQSGGPDRIKYTITVNGKEILQKWLSQPEEPAQNLQATLYLKTVLSILLGGEARVFLDIQRQTHLKRMRELTHKKINSKITDILLIDHALFHLEADLKWIELTIMKLEELKNEILTTNKF